MSPGRAGRRQGHEQIRAWLAADGRTRSRRSTSTFKGEDEEQKAAQAFLGKAFGVALFIMAIILVTQFNSFYSAFLILSAVIMSTIGVMIGLLVTDQPFGIVMSGIGVIALAGIVVNNNIVLIDTFDRLRERRDRRPRGDPAHRRPAPAAGAADHGDHHPRPDADGAADQHRLRHPRGRLRRAVHPVVGQLSTAIAFGLSFATVLTLVVTPSALMVRANFLAKPGGRAARPRGKAVPRGAGRAPRRTAGDPRRHRRGIGPSDAAE